MEKSLYGGQNDVGSHGRIKNINDLMPPVGAILRVVFCNHQTSSDFHQNIYFELSKIGVINRYYS